MVLFWPIAVQPSSQSSPSAFFAPHTPQTPAKLITRRKALDLFNNFDVTVRKTQGYVIHSNSSLKSHVKSKILDILRRIGYLAWHEL
jgi:hypothetical protein